MCKKCIITTLIVFLIIVFGALFFVLDVGAQGDEIVAINEIAWMGTEKNWRDQWIELHNPTQKEIDLEGWVLKSKDGSPHIELTGTIEPGGFYLIVRRSDTYIQQPADIQGYTGNLNNDGETLVLKNQHKKTIDKVDKWHAGNNDTKATMERINPLKPGTDPNNWTDGPPHGTPRAENRKLTLADIPKTNDIVINELIPNPEGPDHENEWIELHNTGGQSHNLEGWKIHGHRINDITIVPPGGFYLVKRSEASYILRDTGDTVELKHPDGTIMDSVSYEGPAEEGISYARFASGWAWTDNPTPGNRNAFPSQSFVQRNTEDTQNQNNNARERTNENNERNTDESEEENNKDTTITTTDPQNLLAQTSKNSLFDGQAMPYIAGLIISLGASISLVLAKKKTAKE